MNRQDMLRILKERIWMGMPVGALICQVVAILESLLYGDGQYLAVSWELLLRCQNSELAAVSIQLVCSLFLGGLFGGASVIWKREDWSLSMQTLVYLGICTAGMLPVAWICGWMDLSLSGILAFLGLYLLIFAAIWILEYCRIRKSILEINEGLRRRRR